MGAHRKRTARGYYFRPERGAWQAYAYINGRQTFLGSFSTERQAARVRAEAERRYGFK
jgi:hypothetical protein